jgi:uncharacterized protein YeaO (DUF488 family)
VAAEKAYMKGGQMKFFDAFKKRFRGAAGLKDQALPASQNVLENDDMPSRPEGLAIAYHMAIGRQEFENNLGILIINKQNIELFVSDYQRFNQKTEPSPELSKWAKLEKRGWKDIDFRYSKVLPYHKRIEVGGNKLRGHIEEKKIALNACSLDFLLSHQSLIPENWKMRDKHGRRIDVFFWGTIYASVLSCRFLVRYLWWDGTRWVDGYADIDEQINGAAAVIADPERRKSHERTYIASKSYSLDEAIALSQTAWSRQLPAPPKQPKK